MALLRRILAALRNAPRAMIWRADCRGRGFIVRGDQGHRGLRAPRAGPRNLQAPRCRAFEDPDRALLEREHDGADRGERSRGGRLPGAALLRAGLGRDRGAAAHDRRAQARFGVADYGRRPVLPLRPLRQEGPPAHLDRGPSDGGPAADLRGQPRADHEPALPAGSGLLPDSRGPTARRAHPVRLPVLQSGPVEHRRGGWRRRRVQGRGSLREPTEAATGDRGQAARRGR